MMVIPLLRLSVIVALSLLARTIEDASPVVRSTPVASHPFGPDSMNRVLRAAQGVDLSVTVDVQGADANWVYTYSIYNFLSSTNAVETFAIRPALGVFQVRTPAHWTGFHGYQGDTLGVVWRVTDSGGLSLPVGDDSVSVYESPYNLQPGYGASGFEVTSTHGPYWINFYARGFENLEAGPEDAKFEDPFIQGPPSIWEAGVTGQVMGPTTQPTVRTGEGRGGTEVEVQPLYPNPTRGEVAIAFYLPRGEDVSLVVRDVAGRLIQTLIHERLGPGTHKTSWNVTDGRGHRVAQGIYYYTLRVGTQKVAERRFAVVR